ncbi:hypothetical protein GF391_00890 [Candidatus Uhrbacteria bacterium]|nr:hypothetical protein [Candidatus Uhrbacteria bacterium]
MVEIGDLFFGVCCPANQLGINLEKGFPYKRKSRGQVRTPERTNKHSVEKDVETRF